MLVLLDRSIPLGPTLSLALLAASLVLTAVDRRERTMNDRRARGENAALVIGYRAGRLAR